MSTLPKLRHRLAELRTMRRIYEARGEQLYLGFLDRMIEDVKAEIAALENPIPPEAP